MPVNTKKTLLFTLILIGITACGTKPAPTPIPVTPTVSLLLPKNTALPTIVTATATPTPVTVTLRPADPPPTSSPVPAMPIPTPMTPLVEYYTIQPGDTLGGISLTYDISVEDLMALNGLTADAIIQAGQTLHVPLRVDRTGPLVTLLPDSEVVYSPAYVDFNTAAFIQQQGGYLAGYTETVDGEELNAAQVINKIAYRFSVGPRVLLALLEYYGGWVTQLQPTAAHPSGSANPYGGLYLQLGWTAARINEGYYGYKQHGSIAVRFFDRSRAVIPYRLNAGTVGVMNVLAVNSNWDTWLTEVDEQTGFIETYRRLFGDPFAYAIEPLIPANLTQPPLELPWLPGETFYYTGGPHAAYVDGSAWAAIDFAPPDVLGSCYYSEKQLVAAAAGQLFLSNKGETYLDLDADGHLQTGWVLLYLHMVANADLVQGQRVTVGTPLGVATCEGGASTSSHLHFARRYNGEWLDAGGPVPMILSGWQVISGPGQYEGGITRGAETKTACECWDNALNALTR